jgi:hypothetical protein
MVVPVSGLSNTSDVERSDSLRSGSPSRVRARCAPALAALTAAVAAAQKPIMQSPGRLLRYAAIHNPRLSAAAADAVVDPSIFSFANGTLSRKVCIGVLL